MYVLKPQIEIGDYISDFVANVQIESTWSNLSDTCEITFPRKLRDENKAIFNETDPLFKVGDAVDVKLWYQGFNPVSRFNGFVVDVSPKLPIKVKCEDAMFLMKQFTLTQSFKSVTLRDLLTYIFTEGAAKEPRLNGYNFALQSEIDLGKFRINRATGAQVFEELKKTYGINTYVRGNSFVVGFSYNDSQTLINEFTFENNIISDSLIYRREEDIKIKVKAVSIDSKNQKTEVELGDSEGEQRTLNYYNKTRDDLIKIANDDLQKLKYSGFRGSFSTFLHPVVKHSEVCKIISEKVPEKNGNYYIAKVVTTFGNGGGRQEVTLDRIAI